MAMTAGPVGEVVSDDPRAFRVDSPWSSVNIPSAGIEVLVPDDWTVDLDVETPMAAIMVCPPDDGVDDFRPTIIIVVEQPEDEQPENEQPSVGSYTAQLCDGLRMTLTDAHVVAVDPLWGGGFEGRRVVTGYRNGRHTLVAQQYVTMGDTGVVTVLTGTSTLGQYLWASDIFAYVAASLTAAAQLPEGSGG